MAVADTGIVSLNAWIKGGSDVSSIPTINLAVFNSEEISHSRPYSLPIHTEAPYPLK